MVIVATLQIYTSLTLSWNDEWHSKHTLSRGSGQTTNELVGNPREMPIRNQKQLVKS